ncbi:MAG TPA: hypothetical protein VLH19_05325 [Patescibacteria group bacterium]|nr:hypothetical protein [Patescibacteria group bacterium]
MKKTFSRLVISCTLAIFSLLQPLAPAIALVYAQDATPTETTQPTDTPVATPEVTIEPIATPTLAPTDTPAPTVEPTSTPAATTAPTPTAAPVATATPEPTATPANTNLSATVVSDPTPVSDTTYFGSLFTDKADYGATETAIITGNGFAPNTTYTLDITSVDSYAFSTLVTTDSAGRLVYNFHLDGTYRPDYLAQLQVGGITVANVSFTDSNPSANLDQCANGPVGGTPTHCLASADWVNGNLGASKSHYLEGNTIPYRMTFGSLSLASHTVTFEWDTTKSDKHATDYLTTFSQTEGSANPCAGTSPCGASTTFPIPADPQVTGASVTPITGNFTLFGGTITSVSAYSYANGTGFTGDKSARISVTFTASQSNPTLAWGGHIATRSDWGPGSSAVSISGSPYHMRLVDLDGSGGNQDRSLSADAIIFSGSITIIKDATPNGSTSFPFTASPSPITNFNLVDDGTSANTRVFSGITTFAGNNGQPVYTVTENTPSGWSLIGIQCSVVGANGGSSSTSGATASIVLKEGEDWTCTYSNQQLSAHLTVIKHVINDNGGTKVAGDFTMNVTATNPSSASFAGSEIGTTITLNAGSYGVDESAVTGYTKALGANCSGTIAAGETKICTITNDDQAPSLTLVKQVSSTHGGNAPATDWTLSANGPTPISGAGGTASNGTFVAGTYALSESTGPAGYSAGSWNCVGGTQNGASITVGLGQAATCTIINSDIAPTLKLNKIVTNDNGGNKTSHDWTLSATGTSGTFSDLGDSPTQHPVVAGVSYALSESVVAGYDAGTFTCDSGVNVVNGHITLALGQNVTCTVTNNDQAAHLIVIKHVINNNGGTKVAGDFTMTIHDVTTTNQSFAGVENPGVDSVLTTVGTYNVTENGLAGYNASYSADCTGTIALGQTKTCTITNDDAAPSLTLVKQVITDNGGTAINTDWILTATGPTSIHGAGGVASDNTFSAGSYVLSESVGPAGYAAGSWNCIGGTQNGSSISLVNGQSAICTITNDDIQPKLTVTKVVVNDNGGTKIVANFPLFVSGASVTSGVQNGFNAGTYSLTETGDAGYATSDWTGDCNAAGSVTLHAGDVKSCTITNDDKVAHLTVIKHVINDNGGTASASAFTMNVTGSSVSNPSFPGDEGGITVTLNAGSYGVDEIGVTGYAKTLGTNCAGTIANGETKICTITNNDIAPKLTLVKTVTNDDGGTKQVADFPLFVNGSPVTSGTQNTLSANVAYTASETGNADYQASAWGTDCDATGHITLQPGDEKTCTITNDDIGPTLKLVKTVINNNGGTTLSSAWDLTAHNDLDNRSFTDAGNSTTFHSVRANVGYVLSESVVTGYDQVGWICDGGTYQGGILTLGLHQNVTCTVTNDDIAPKLHLRKVVVNDNGGTATTSDFTLTANGTDTNDLSGTSPVDSGATLQADTFVLGETSSKTGYSASAWSCVGGVQSGSSVYVNIDGEATCTITNDDIQPTLTLVKQVDNAHGGTLQVSNFPLSVGTTGVVSGATNGFNAGTYTASEIQQFGYTSTGWTGDCDSSGSVTLAIGENKTCTIVNHDVQPTLTLIKHVTNNNGGTKQVADFLLNVSGTGVVSGVTTGFDVGNYTAGEANLPGYTASSWTGDCNADGSVSLTVGQNKTCEITNDDIGPTLTIVKDADPNDLQDFTFGGTLGAFTLDNDQGVVGEDVIYSDHQLFSNLIAGAQSVTEAQPNQFWTLQSANCVNTVGGTTFPSTLNGLTLGVNLPLAANVTCTFTNHKSSPTRTLGFWQTHTAYTSTQFAVHPFTIGNNGTHKGPIAATDSAKIFGAFYAPIAKDTTGKKRLPVDQTRVILLQQLVAAKLNCGVFGCSSSVHTLIAQADAAYASGDMSAMSTLTGQLDAYNNSGDTIIIGNAGSATPQTSKGLADLVFWNLP